ncbi:hypothetical protein PVIIG_04865 [Plasmodium vivax India VII]|nr:hypothetical protein PVIIG_04865 [Plasmodium vivax India VII]
MPGSASVAKRRTPPGRSLDGKDPAAPILPNDGEDTPDEAREHFFAWYSSPPDEGERDPWENFDEYLTVLNSVDKYVVEDRGRESDSCCSDECREGVFPQPDATKRGPKGGAPDASYSLVSDVLSYAFS